MTARRPSRLLIAGYAALAGGAISFGFALFLSGTWAAAFAIAGLILVWIAHRAIDGPPSARKASKDGAAPATPAGPLVPDDDVPSEAERRTLTLEEVRAEMALVRQQARERHSLASPKGSVPKPHAAGGAADETAAPVDLARTEVAGLEVSYVPESDEADFPKTQFERRS
jgi:hypothetical protein